MQAMVFASSVIRANQPEPRADADEVLQVLRRAGVELVQARVAAMATGIALYVGLLGVLGRHATATDTSAVHPIAASAALHAPAASVQARVRAPSAR